MSDFTSARAEEAEYPIKCPFCDRRFLNAQAAGGHASRVHTPRKGGRKNVKVPEAALERDHTAVGVPLKQKCTICGADVVHMTKHKRTMHGLHKRRSRTNPPVITVGSGHVDEDLHVEDVIPIILGTMFPHGVPVKHVVAAARWITATENFFKEVAGD